MSDGFGNRKDLESLDKAELIERLMQLEDKLSDYESRNQTKKKFTALFTKFSFRIIAGKSLKNALANIINALESQKKPQAEDVADLTVAIFNRIVRVGIISVLIVAIPGTISTAAFIWQGKLIEQQTEQLITSNSMDALSRQIAIIDFMSDAADIYLEAISIYISDPTRKTKNREEFEELENKIRRAIPYGLTIRDIPSRLFDTGMADSWRELMEDIYLFFDEDITDAERKELCPILREKLEQLREETLDSRRYYGSFLLEKRPHWE